MAKKICSCSRVFDPFGPKKKASGGPGDKCEICSQGQETTTRYVGRMIFDHKTAPSLEVKLGTSVVHEAPRSETRRGGVPEVVVPQTRTTYPTIPAPLPCIEPPKEATGTWYDPHERKVYKVINGEVYVAEVPGALMFTRMAHIKRDRLSVQKSRLLAALKTLELLLGF
jgi:hypothetical protein